MSNETTGDAILRVCENGGKNIAALNFASARVPGGGFQKGAHAQEEMLCRASGLWPCLCSEQVKDFYHGAPVGSCIFSPFVPFFRRDDGSWLPSLIHCSIITCAAPDMRSVIDPNGDKYRACVQQILFVAKEKGITTLIAGAFGCGVYRNDPGIASTIWAEELKERGSFLEHVIFAIPASTTHNTFAAFFGK